MNLRDLQLLLGSFCALLIRLSAANKQREVEFQDLLIKTCEANEIIGFRFMTAFRSKLPG